jgi:hypothetical protein
LKSSFAVLVVRLPMSHLSRNWFLQMIRGKEIIWGNLANYYDEVIACIGDAETILIFGPGEAKGELKKRMERDKIGIRIVAMETADKMTQPQIVAKVKQMLS